MENRKVSMDTMQKQHAGIEFLTLEGRPGGKIAIRLNSVYEEAAYSRATVFQWISKIRSGNSEFQSDRPRDTPSTRDG
jgi:hypothetical protein